jgi:hypothetical protein
MAELVRDSQLGLAPLSAAAATDLLDGTRAGRLLDGFHGTVLDRPAALDALVRVSWLVHDLAADGSEVELDVNPLIVHARGAVAVDALVRSVEASR